MNSDVLGNRVLQISFLISLAAHGIIFLPVPSLEILSASKKEQKIEVTYLKIPREKKTEIKNPLPKREPFLKLSSRIIADKKLPPPFVDKEELYRGAKALAPKPNNFVKPNFKDPDVIAVKKKITLPPIDMDKINNPSYISYYQIVREKIKRAAYQNYSRTDTGEVYLSFVISNDGYIKALRLSEEKSSSNAYLKEISVKSIKDASPFPNFPKELDYPQLSFNVVISFEIE